jgi:hypothetical protein
MGSTKFYTFDEAVIDSDIDTVYKEMIIEFSGNKGWWKHLWESTSRNNIPITRSGGSVDITVHAITDANFAARTISIKDKEKLEIEFFEGDFVGHATWRWTPEGDKTRVSQEWHASPNSIKLKVISTIFDIEKIHSNVISGGFKALNMYLITHAKM